MHTVTKLGCLFVAVLWTAPSPAQTNWEKHPGNPVLSIGPNGSWDDTKVNPGSVVFDEGRYKMWYTGWDGALDRNFQIGLATSPDGIVWIKHPGNPVVAPGGTGAWDAWSTSDPAVSRDSGVYKMWYSGSDGSRRSIGYATSMDGIEWTKYGANPVMQQGDVGSWESWASHWCSVIKNDTVYEMWYSGGQDLFSHELGYASSPNGIEWTKYDGNPIIAPGPDGSWYDNTVWFPCVLLEASIYHMWFTGHDGSRNRIGYAFSLDGLQWFIHQGPVLDRGDSGEWDDESVGSPYVVREGATHKMWYLGQGDGTVGHVGYATSTGTSGGPEAVTHQAGKPHLGASFPNPAQEGARITLRVPTTAATRPVNLRIYDTSGRLVRSLLNGLQPAGRQTVSWDGTSRTGTTVGTGVYFWRLQWNGTTQTRRVTLVR